MPPTPHQSLSRLAATKWVEQREPRSRDKQHFNSRGTDASGLSFSQSAQQTPPVAAELGAQMQSDKPFCFWGLHMKLFIVTSHPISLVITNINSTRSSGLLTGCCTPIFFQLSNNSCIVLKSQLTYSWKLSDHGHYSEGETSP